MRAVRTLRDIKFKKGTLVKGSIELVTQENRIVQGIFMNEIIQGFECEYVDVAIILQENESLKNPEKQIHVRMVRDSHQGSGSIKAGTELFGRIIQVDPLCKMFQCTIGEHSGKEVPFKFYVEIAGGKTYAEQRVIELKQENLQRLEEVKGLQSKVESLTEYSKRKSNEIRILNEDVGKAWAAFTDEYAERALLEATLERALLDHQPVVLPKEVVKEIDYLLTGLTSMGIVNLVSNKKGNGLTNHCISWVYKDDSKTVERQNLFLKALDNGYTVEQTVEEANEAAFRAGMEAIYKEMDKEPFNSTAEKRAELAGRLIPLIKEIYQH